MTRQELMDILPHREGMLLLDEAFMEGETAHGVYRVKGDEWFLNGHFPGKPIVPGVVLLEILAQSVAVLLSSEMQGDKTPMYTGLDKVRFKSPVLPGDTFETKCRITKIKRPFFFAEGEGFANGKLAVKAEFSFAVIDNGRG